MWAIQFSLLCGMQEKEDLEILPSSEVYCIQEKLKKILNFSPESFIIQLAKNFIFNDLYKTDPILISENLDFIAECKAYKKGKEKYFNMIVSCQKLEDDAECIRERASNALNYDWQERKNNYENINLKQAQYYFYNEFGFKAKQQAKKEKKMHYALTKIWMQRNDFPSTRFFIKTICEKMGKADSIEEETLSILNSLKKYDNK